MDVINDRVIDIGLNVLGYLMAGSLGMLLHSTVRKRRLRGTGPAPAPSPGNGTPVGDTAAGDSRPEIEFVDLKIERPRDPVPADSLTGPTPRGGHRNRREIIRLAREMLAAGTSSDQISNTLPVSRSELALLQNTNPQ